MRLVKSPTCIVLIGLLCLPMIALAQSTYGSILGTVTDQTGARVPGVKVTITHQEENTSRTVAADQAGNYEALNLKAGHYSVRTEATGFKTYSAHDLELAARQALRVNVALEVGSVAESINVEAGAQVVTTDTSTIMTSFENKQVIEIPANYRGAGSTSPLRVLAFQVGVQSDNSWGFAVQGAAPVSTEITLDGISTIGVSNNRPMAEVFPSAESISEMKVQAVGNNAEYGQVGDITTTSRGGGNNFHGSLFEYMQNRRFDATAYGSTSKAQKTANTFGGSLGGPVKKNRTFFFGTFEGMRYRTGTTLQGTVPTAAMRTGDLSKETTLLKDPLGSTPFANQTIPTSRLNSVALNVLKYYPLPNYGTTDVLKSSNYRLNAAAPTTSNQWDARIDHVITSKQSIFGRLSFKDQDTVSPMVFTLPADTSYNDSRSLAVSHVYTITPTLVNEFRFGFAINDSATTYNFDGKQLTAEIGTKSPSVLTFNGLPRFAFGSGIATFGKGKPGFTFSHSYQWNNNTTWSKGRHTVKFGGDMRKLRAQTSLGFSGSDNYGNAGFDGSFTGKDMGDFLIGLPYGTSYASVKQDNDGQAWHYALYVQDSFKATSKLTLEYGLRWEYHPPFLDSGSNITNFDRSVKTTGRVIIPSTQQAKDITAPGFLLSINACPAESWNGIPCTPFLAAKDAGWPDTLRNAQKKNFNPRFGFAYRPFGDTNTVIRGGVGRYTMTMLGGVFYGLTGVSSSDVREFVNAVVSGVPRIQLPYLTYETSGVKSSAYGSAYFGTAEDPDFKDPYSYQWNLSVERALGWETGLRVSYIGMRTMQMPWAPDLNQPLPSTTAYTSRPLTDRPFPYWGRIYSYDTGANAIYNALQTEVNHRVKGGLTFNTGWTWAKNLSDGNGPASTGWAGATGGGRVTNSLDRAADRGNVAMTRRHRWVSTVFYDLPFGKGRKFGSSMNPIADAVAGGWRLSTITMLETGPYLTPTFTGGDPSGTNAPARGSMRPDAVSDGNLDNPTASMWFNRYAFVCPGRVAGASDQFSCNVTPIARFGTAGTGTLVGPGSINLSMGFGKDFRIKERAKLKFDATFTNLPNHPNLADPGTAITAVNFGVITTARGADSGGNRVGQFSLRLEF